MFILGVQTLQRITLIKCAIILVKAHSNLLKNSINIRFGNVYQYFKCDEHSRGIETAANMLLIPHHCKRLLILLIRYMAIELQRWIKYLNQYVFDSTRIGWTRLEKIIKNTQWTQHGEIDERKTAQVLITLDKELTISDRYKIASNFCLHDEVINIWNQLSNSSKLGFVMNRITEEWDETSSDFGNLIIQHWTDFLSCFDDTNDNSYNMLNWAINRSNLSAVNYFWYKLTDEQRSVCTFPYFDHFIDDGNSAAVIFFLLSHMNEHQLNYYFLIQISDILQIFIANWIYAEFVIPIIKHVGHSNIEFNVYDQLLYSATINMTKFSGDECKEIFVELWTNASSEFQKLIIENELRCCVCFKELCKVQDFNIIELFLQDVSLVDRRKILFYCFFDISEMDWNFFKFITRKLISNAEEMAIFKEKCTIESSRICSRIISEKENQWTLMDKLLCFCVSTEEKIIDLKKSLVYECNDLIRCITDELFSDEREIIFTDKILNWFLLTSQEIFHFKRNKLVYSSYFIRNLYKCICEDENNSIHKCLSWCFSSQDEINQYKKELPFKKNFFSFLKYSRSCSISRHFSWANDTRCWFNSIKKFLDFCLHRSEKLPNDGLRLTFILSTLQPCEYSKPFFQSSVALQKLKLRSLKVYCWNVVDSIDTQVLSKYGQLSWEFQLLDDILNLYYSKEEMEKLKRNVLFSQFGLSLCIDYISTYINFSKDLYLNCYDIRQILTEDELREFENETNIEEIKNYLCWLNPTLETILDYKQMIKCEKFPFLLHPFKDLFLNCIDKIFNK